MNGFFESSCHQHLKSNYYKYHLFMLKVPLLIASEIRKYVMSETTFHFLQLCAQLIVLQFFFVQKQRKLKRKRIAQKYLLSV